LSTCCWSKAYAHDQTVMVITKRIHQPGSNSSHHVDQSVLLKSLAQLWEQQELCDCVLVSADQHHFHAHRLVLTAASHYFKVLFLGSGQQMQNSVTKDDCGLYTIHLDEVDSHSLKLVMQAIYQQDFQVRSPNHTPLYLYLHMCCCSDNIRVCCFQITEAVLEHLLMAASYLQIESIITACAQVGWGAPHSVVVYCTGFVIWPKHDSLGPSCHAKCQVCCSSSCKRAVVQICASGQ